MKLELIDLSPSEEARMWAYVPGHPLQAVLHNELVKKINEDRDYLENCEADQLPEIKARIRARRELLGFLHRHDKPKQ